jgi:hypothetical protein
MTLLGIGDERKRGFLRFARSVFSPLQISARPAEQLALDTPRPSPYVRGEALALSPIEC